jgi:hypothetical protein
MICCVSHRSYSCLSLAPGFSPVKKEMGGAKPFQRFIEVQETVETVSDVPVAFTGLKPGANERTATLLS